MGAWGYGPFDNDSALDWLNAIEKPMVREIVSALKKVKANKRRDGYHEAIAASQVLLDHCRNKHCPDLTYGAMEAGAFGWAVLAIEIMQKDQQWIESWKAPFGIKITLRKLHRSLLRRNSIELKRREKIRLRIVSRRVKYQGKRKPKAA